MYHVDINGDQMITEQTRILVVAGEGKEIKILPPDMCSNLCPQHIGQDCIIFKKRLVPNRKIHHFDNRCQECIDAEKEVYKVE